MNRSTRGYAVSNQLPSGHSAHQVEVALLDREGVIVSVNDAWVDFCEANGGDLSRAGVGVSYLDICAAGIDSTTDEIREAILVALDGDIPSPSRISTPCHSPETGRWFDVLISSRFDDDGQAIGACVTFSETQSPLATRTEPNAQSETGALFENASDRHLVLDLDFRIVAVTDGYLMATMTERDAVVGRGLFEVFPDAPDDASVKEANLDASLQRVIGSRAQDTMPVQKHHIRHPEGQGSGFEERFWRPVNTPLLDTKGEVAWIVHTLEDVTEQMRTEDRLEAGLLNKEVLLARDGIYRDLEDQVAVRAVMRLCDIAAEVSGATGAVITLLADELALGSLCTTDGVAAYLDDLQYSLGEGPSIDANRVGRAMMEPELGSPNVDRWPAFTPPAIQAGARAIFAFPIRIGARRIGALTLYRDRPGPLVGEQHKNALVVADIAARTVLSIQAEAPPGSVGVELEDGANFHFIVHQAAGILSAQLEIGVTEALVRLRSRAFLLGTQIDQVAESVVAGRLRFSDTEST